ncbi:MAG: acetyl-CoA carboxylase biotin carboxyl carrier protein [Alphaproteobacteria bacterium]|nr:MAG: acetyl-CoA carboxylase biotin carboxyl carrier protein [Alphaproteobacteria bacterium]
MPKFSLDAALVRQLAGLLDETGLTEIEYATSDVRVRVVRQGVPISVTAPLAPPPNAGAPAATPAEQAASNPDTVTSPMVGTAYLSPEPGARPFVNIGDTVRQGQTLLIIEAMKVMNPLPAPKSGVVRQIFVRDGQPVEFGEPLICVE